MLHHNVFREHKIAEKSAKNLIWERDNFLELKVTNSMILQVLKVLLIFKAFPAPKNTIT